VESLGAPAKDAKKIPSQAIIIKTRGGKRSGRSLADGEEKGEAATRGPLSLVYVIAVITDTSVRAHTRVRRGFGLIRVRVTEALATARRAASLSGALLSAESASSEEELVNLRAERMGESRERCIRLSLSLSLSLSLGDRAITRDAVLAVAFSRQDPE